MNVDGENNMPMGGKPNNGKDSPFDTGFDAGVEADEDEDPKKFIQQLTGKLSQSLNTYEDKDDEGLYKYVGKMIVKQVAKNLDEKGKKDLIKSINMTDAEQDDEDYDDDENPNEIHGTDNGNAPEYKQDEEPLQEISMKKCNFKKKYGLK